MKYDIEKEEQQFMNFINDQYNVYKEIDNIYRDYVKLPLLLSDALFTLSKHAGMYAMMRLKTVKKRSITTMRAIGNWSLPFTTS
jgi:hypothetical protein